MLSGLASLASPWIDDLLVPLELGITFVLLALPQWLVLRRYLLGLRAVEWFWRTLAGWLAGAVAAGLALFALSFSTNVLELYQTTTTTTTNTLGVTLSLATVSFVIGVAVGAVQWPALARYGHGNRFAWGLVSGVLFVLSAGTSRLIVALGISGVPANLISGFVGGVLGGLVTGLVLLRILRQPVSVQVEYAREERAAAIAGGVRIASSEYLPGRKPRRRKGRK